MEQEMIIVTSITASITCMILGYCVGYIKGMKKQKEFDVKIIEEFVNKYSR